MRDDDSDHTTDYTIEVFKLDHRYKSGEVRVLSCNYTNQTRDSIQHELELLKNAYPTNGLHCFELFETSMTKMGR